MDDSGPRQPAAHGDLEGLPAALLRRLVDAAPVGIVVTRLDGTYVYASPGAELVMGPAPRSVPGTTKHEMFPPEVAQRLAELERKLVEHGTRETAAWETAAWETAARETAARETAVVPMTTPFGERTFLVDKFLIEGSGGPEPLICTFVTDVTPLRDLERELIGSQQQLLRVLEDARVVVLRADAAGRIRNLWRGPVRFTGAPRPSAIGDSITDFIGDQAVARDVLRRALAGEAFVEVLDVLGVTLEVHIAPEGPHGTPGSFSCVALDVTERAAAERTRDATLATLEGLLAQSPLAIVAVEFVNTKVPLYMSSNMQRMFGFSSDAAPFSPEWLAAQMHPDDLPAASAFMRAVALDRTRGHECEFRFRRAEGEYRWIHVRSELLYDDGGRPIGVVAFSTDITDQVRADEDRRRLEAQLHRAERLESLGQLAGGLAHDFNNLLVVIANYAQFVESAVRRHAGSSVPLGDEAAAGILDDLRQIRRASENAAALTRQLLVFGRREVVARSTFDLGAVVREMRDMLSRTLGEAVVVHVRLTDADLPVRADPGQVQQVLLNLVVNARHAMPDGGTLEVATRRVAVEAGHRGGSGVLAPGAHAELTVSDTGEGMSDAVREHAFEPFFTTKGPGEGTGLGLATVYAVVTESGGDIELVSAPGVGTTVRILLPLTGTAAALPTMIADPAGAREGESVLVVEDQPAVLELTRRVLTEHGYQVRAASGGDEALTIAALDGRIDLLLTDVMMPGMLGDEVARRVRALRPSIKVLHMTGYSHAASETSDPLSGGVVVKPFTPGQLLARVRDILDT